MQIATAADYEVALNRVQTLTGCIENSAEERELAAIADAIGEWESA